MEWLKKLEFLRKKHQAPWPCVSLTGHWVSRTLPESQCGPRLTSPFPLPTCCCLGLSAFPTEPSSLFLSAQLSNTFHWNANLIMSLLCLKSFSGSLWLIEKVVLSLPSKPMRALEIVLPVCHAPRPLSLSSMAQCPVPGWRAGPWILFLTPKELPCQAPPHSHLLNSYLSGLSSNITSFAMLFSKCHLASSNLCYCTLITYCLFHSTVPCYRQPPTFPSYLSWELSFLLDL